MSQCLTQKEPVRYTDKLIKKTTAGRVPVRQLPDSYWCGSDSSVSASAARTSDACYVAMAVQR